MCERTAPDSIRFMVGFVPKTITMIGLCALCFYALLGYYNSGLSGSSWRPSAAIMWIALAIGFSLTGGGLIAATLRLDRRRRIVLAFSLLAFGIISSVLGLAIAHVGGVLLVFAFPALLFGAIVCLMAALSKRSDRKGSLAK
jgi:hypothetical protein